MGHPLTTWRFFAHSGTTNRSITPLLLESTGGTDYVLRAIGQTHTVGAGGIFASATSPALAFNVQAGDATIHNANYRFGWKDGTQTSANQGVISFDVGGSSSVTTLTAPGVNSSRNLTGSDIGSSFTFTNGPLFRTYSFEATAANIFSDFSFGSGTPFGGNTVLAGVTVTVSSTNTAAFGASSFADDGGANAASVTFTFNSSISEFYLDVARVRADEFLTGFNIGDPTSLSGTLVNNGGLITTSNAFPDDFGSGRLSWTGIDTASVSFTIGGPPVTRMRVDQFGLVPIVELLTAPPAGVALHQLKSNSKIFVFDELQGVTLTSDVAVDIGTNPVPDGTKVNSHYIHFDPFETTTLSGTITYNNPIIGVIVNGSKLNASDDALGIPTTNYRLPAGSEVDPVFRTTG
ncbi:MAG: hypothetical protein BZY88_10825 [SAR202 cluster bacterium Io17-Chloro-G9]|nr:MAG: hypothetical protein BZY88_10825 [SAR202 cluster bacterium Io17-Chloro-G9]